MKGAQRGHSLLKKKSDALTLRFRAVLKQIIKVLPLEYRVFLFAPSSCPQNKTLVGEVLKEAHFFIAESKFIAGNFGYEHAAALLPVRPVGFAHMAGM